MVSSLVLIRYIKRPLREGSFGDSQARLRLGSRRVVSGAAVGATGALNAVAAVRVGAAALVGTLLTIRVLLFEGLDGFSNLAIIFEVFPERDLITVDDHLVIRFMQFTTELDQGNAGVAGAGAGSGAAIGGLQVVNVSNNKILTVQCLDLAEVHLAGIQEDSLQLAAVDILALSLYVIIAGGGKDDDADQENDNGSYCCNDANPSPFIIAIRLAMVALSGADSRRLLRTRGRPLRLYVAVRKIHVSSLHPCYYFYGYRISVVQPQDERKEKMLVISNGGSTLKWTSQIEPLRPLLAVTRVDK
jgi:hypothetical protein